MLSIFLSRNQTAEAADAAYLPALQSEQVPTAVAPTTAENLLAPQSVQLEEPADAWNLPAGHDVHVTAS
jgi:hypothetical protein